jgi:hypothetical protein
MRRILAILAVCALAACAWPKLPPPNSTVADYDSRSRSIQLTVSGLQPASEAALVGQDGNRYPAAGLSVISAPHVLYNPPPSISLGIGGFGLSGCCSAFGSGVGVGVPIGQPTVAEASDQYVSSALIPAPPDYPQHWMQYHLEVAAGLQRMDIAAPAPTG